MGNAALQERGADQLPDGSLDKKIGLRVCPVRFGVEREFARRLDEREDIKLFVKLPAWFLIDTPVGKYNPGWAILKHNGQALYLVRETKGTRDFLKLRTIEADKVRCGLKHFETLGVPFQWLRSLTKSIWKNWSTRLFQMSCTLFSVPGTDCTLPGSRREPPAGAACYLFPLIL